MGLQSIISKKDKIEIYWNNAPIYVKAKFLIDFNYLDIRVKHKVKQEFYELNNRTMKKIIYKYKLDMFRGAVQINMPLGSKVINFAGQNGVPNFWVEIDQEIDESQSRNFLLVFTGEEFEINNNATFIGTAFCGALVIHAYELHN